MQIKRTPSAIGAKALANRSHNYTHAQASSQDDAAADPGTASEAVEVAHAAAVTKIKLAGRVVPSLG